MREMCSSKQAGFGREERIVPRVRLCAVSKTLIVPGRGAIASIGAMLPGPRLAILIELTGMSEN